MLNLNPGSAHHLFLCYVLRRQETHSEPHQVKLRCTQNPQPTAYWSTVFRLCFELAVSHTKIVARLNKIAIQQAIENSYETRVYFAYEERKGNGSSSFLSWFLLMFPKAKSTVIHIKIIIWQVTMNQPSNENVFKSKILTL